MLAEFGKWGLPGLIIAVLFFQNFFLVRKIVEVIQNNTQALTQLKEHCRVKNPPSP
jgi:hypothetical protein